MIYFDVCNCKCFETVANKLQGNTEAFVVNTNNPEVNGNLKVFLTPSKDINELYEHIDLRFEEDGVKGVLLTSFCWADSPEGHDFWEDLYYELGDAK